MIECENCILEKAVHACEVDCLVLEDALREHDKQIKAEAFDEVMNLPKHYYKTYRSGFIEEEQAIFISDIRQLKEQNSIMDSLKPKCSNEMPKDIICNCTEEQKKIYYRETEDEFEELDIEEHDKYIRAEEREKVIEEILNKVSCYISEMTKYYDMSKDTSFLSAIAEAQKIRRIIWKLKEQTK